MRTEIFRVEDADHVGPYQPLHNDGDDYYSKKFYWNNFNDNDMRHPAPAMDLPIKEGTKHRPLEYKYGFSSMAQLKAWFNKPRRAWLRKHGYKIVRYCADAADLLIGKKQTAFYSETAKRLPGEQELPA